MARSLGSYSVRLFHLATAWRFGALCAIALALTPASLAQTSELITPTFNPPYGWDGLDLEVAVSQGSSDDYYAQFFCDSSKWSRLMMSVAVRAKEHGTDGEAALFEDGKPVLTFAWDRGGVPYEIPVGMDHIYNYTIIAKSDSPDSRIFVYSIFAVKEARSDSSSTQSKVSTTTVLSSAASPISSTAPPTALINIPTTLGPTVPTEPLSPTAYTNSASVSDAEQVSSGSKSSGPSRSTIIGAVFGALVGLTLIIFAVVLYRLRRVRSHIAPSTAFMSYRSTTEQPPAYPFTRTTFFRRSRAGLANFGGLGDYKASSPQGATARADRTKLMSLDGRSVEGRDSSTLSPVIAPELEEPQRLFVLYQASRGMGVAGGDIGGRSLGVAGVGASGPVGSSGPSTHRIPRKLVPPLSTTFDEFASTQSFWDQNPYDGLAMPETAVNPHADPFLTPPATAS